MSHHDVLDTDGVRIQAGKCDTCIFRPGNRMHLQPGRVRGMVDTCIRDQGVIPCHKTLGERKQAICRGFFDAYQNEIQLLQLAVRMSFVKEVEV